MRPLSTDDRTVPAVSTAVRGTDLARRYGEGAVRRRRAARRDARRPERRVHRDHGPVRLRQVDAHAHPRGARPAHGRDGRDRRPGRHRDGRQRADRAAARRTSASSSSSSTCSRCSPRRRTSSCRSSCPGTSPSEGWVDELIDQVGLLDRRTHRPAELSGGQQQRVADRAGARHQADRAVRRRADGQPRLAHERGDPRRCCATTVDAYGQTTVMVTHEPGAAAIADRVAVPRRRAASSATWASRPRRTSSRR